MNTIDIKLNEPVTLNFTGPKGDVFNLVISCGANNTVEEEVVVKPTNTLPTLTPRGDQAAADVRQIVSAMIISNPNDLRKIGTVFYTIKLAKQYTTEALSTAFATLLGYEQATFKVVYSNSIESERADVCDGIIYEIQSALLKAGLTGIY